MGMFFYCFCTVLLLPCVMLFCGHRFRNAPPRRINFLFGYRTKRSMKNEDTWRFAHHRLGTIWWKLGWPVLAVSVLLMLTALGQDEASVSTRCGVAVSLQLLPLIASTFPVERALRQKFDDDGNPRA